MRRVGAVPASRGALIITFAWSVLAILHCSHRVVNPARRRRETSETGRSREAAATSAVAAGGNRSILLVHVGKAGGSTFSHWFWRRHWKDDGNVFQRSLPRICHIHDCGDDKLKNITSLLFIARDPITRMISTYGYSHPDNCVRRNVTKCYISGCDSSPYTQVFYHNCAPSLEDLANVPFTNTSLGHQRFNPYYSCGQAIVAYTRGPPRHWGLAPHAHYNYGYYWSKTIDWHDRGRKALTGNAVGEGAALLIPTLSRAERELIVVRTEHLWEDVSELDRMMGGTGAVSAIKDVTHCSQDYQNYTKFISPGGYKRLCCMMGEEMNVYEDIINSAVNLKRSEKEATIREMEKRCGILDHSSRESWASSCREELHQFTKEK